MTIAVNVCRVDPLSALLDVGERVADVRLCAPWSVALEVSPGPAMVAVLDGSAWCHPEDGDAPPVHLQTGDLVFLRPDGRRWLSDSAVAPTAPSVANDRRADTPRPDSLGSGTLRVGAPKPGAPTAGAGASRLFIRPFRSSPAPTAEFFSVLAPELVLSTARDSQMWEVLRDEADHLSVARSSVLSRVLDLLLIDAMRRWVSDGEAHGWMRATLDPVVGAALRLFHETPEHPWTLQEVSDLVGATRASLSRRFDLLVGEPPMTYLRQWRLTRAATLLEEGVSVTSVARSSGFEDPFEFSAAFSSKYGVSPARYRETGVSAGSA